MADDDLPPIIIKKIKKVSGGGHGSSACKVAYADFVTAMMAFFMLLWLLNVSTDEQKSGIADYFSPTAASTSTSGSGDILGGVSMASDGAKGDGAPQVVLDLEEVTSKESEEEMRSQAEEDAFIEAKEKLQQAIQDDEELRELAKNLLIDMTPEGLRIQARKIMTRHGAALIEEYIDGVEYSVLVAEDPENPTRPTTYTPIQYRFPIGESFKHSKLKWTDYDGLECTPIADAALARRLREESARFFTALDGTSFGRCDIRVSRAGTPFMLEINPNCGVYYPASDPGTADIILAHDPAGHEGFTRQIVAAALAR